MAETTARRRSRHNKSVLPNDIIFHHIAPRLPVKSVLRLMTVSKGFYFFLKTHKFAKMHLHHVTSDRRQNHEKRLVLSTTEPYKFTTIDCESPDQDLSLPSRPLPYTLPRCPPYMSILTSFHGLLCVGFYNKHDQRWNDYLILWNPVTGDYKVLPKNYGITGSDHDTLFGLYYSACDDDYKLVNVKNFVGAYIYSLKSNSWRKLVDFKTAKTYTYATRSVWLNENLYFLITYPALSILRFDTKNEKFAEITTPSKLSSLVDLDVKNVYLIVHRGCIHLCAIYDGMRRLIVMKNEADGVWTKVNTSDILPMFEYGLKWLLHWMRNGNWLMICTSKITRGSYLYKFNRKKKAYTYLGMFTGGVTFPDEGRYIETLVSPKQYMSKQ